MQLTDKATTMFGHIVFPNLKSRLAPNVDLGEGLAILIPCASQGKKMKSIGPKALVELKNGQTVISRQIAILRKRFPCAEIIVVVGFDGDKVYRHIQGEARVLENPHFEETNVVRTLDVALRATLAEHVLIVYGDLVFGKSLFEGVDFGQSWALADHDDHFCPSEVGMNVIDDEVQCFAFGHDLRWGQMAYLTGKELTKFRTLAADRDRHRCFTFELLNQIIDEGGTLKPYYPEDYHIVEIDCAKDIEEALKVK